MSEFPRSPLLQARPHPASNPLVSTPACPAICFTSSIGERLTNLDGSAEIVL
jgi:hypothetical protein